MAGLPARNKTWFALEDRVSSLVAGARAAWARARSKALLGVLGAGVLLAAAAAELERRVASFDAVDRALGGAAFGLVLPLGAYLLVERLCQGERYQNMHRTLRRSGANGRQAAMGSLLVAGALGMLFGGVTATISVLVARGASDPSMARDAILSGVVGMWGGLAYVSMFLAASSLTSRSWALPACLVADWLLGTGSSVLAVPWPRAHLRNLLGFEPVVGMAQTTSMTALLVSFAAFTGLAVWRTDP